MGTSLLAVVPLGLGQVNQLHDSKSDSPTAKVLLVPSVMSRSEEVPPSRAMMPVKVRLAEADCRWTTGGSATGSRCRVVGGVVAEVTEVAELRPGSSGRVVGREVPAHAGVGPRDPWRSWARGRTGT